MRTRGTAIVLLAAVGFAVALLVPAGSTAYRIPDHVYQWPHAPLPVRAVFADFSIITYYDVSAFRWSVARGARRGTPLERAISSCGSRGGTRPR